MTTRAKIQVRFAKLSQDFGDGFARRIFGDEGIDSLPKFSKGKNIGKTKASIAWIKIESGGWIPEIGVENRKGAIVAAIVFSQNEKNGVTEWYFVGEKVREKSEHFRKLNERGHINEKGWAICNCSFNDIDQAYCFQMEYAKFFTEL